MVRLTTLCCFAMVMTACGPRELRVTMNADNNSGQSGFAVIEDRGGSKIFVTVETSAPDYFVKGQLIHIHEGNCGEVGERKFGLELMKPLADPTRFGTEVEVALPMKTFATGDWLINIHDERDNLIYVSCGEIPKP